MVAWTLTGRESMLGVLARWLRRRSREVRSALAVTLRFVLMLAGLGGVSLGAWTLAHWLGYMVAGVSLLVIEAMVKRQ